MRLRLTTWFFAFASLNTLIFENMILMLSGGNNLWKIRISEFLQLLTQYNKYNTGCVKAKGQALAEYYDNKIMTNILYKY